MQWTFWKNRRVFITGHTGFKGSWLSLWLNSLGAHVFGYSLSPTTSPNLFESAGIEELVEHSIGDVCDLDRLRSALQNADPEVVFHLAAQPLVRRSYHDPVGTFAVNVMGTVHVLEAVRGCPNVHSVVVITTDKCYENREWCWGYRETDMLGGHDPYSASKACAELVVASYRRAFFNREPSVGIATARAGNVIGGGDWAEDRLIPDVMRAMLGGRVLEVRYPQAVRPWQHVLEPLRGYLLLAERLFHQPQEFAGPWNFGPYPDDAITVSDLLGRLNRLWEQIRWQPVSPEPALHEAGWLYLDWSKARYRLGWKPCWSIDQALRATVEWYRAVYERSADARGITLQQIDQYQQDSHAA